MRRQYTHFQEAFGPAWARHGSLSKPIRNAQRWQGTLRGAPDTTADGRRAGAGEGEGEGEGDAGVKSS